MIGIDLFSGAGGMALGASQSGIRIKLAVEIDKYAALTYKHNHAYTEVIVHDVLKLPKIKISSNGQNKILFGGPPCQGFSTSNQRTRSILNKDNWLFRGLFKIIDTWKPDWIVFENVRGIIDTENGFFLDQIKKGLEQRSFFVFQWNLNAADFGVPQNRYRVFIVASKHKIDISAPDPNIERKITVMEAISDLPDLPNGATFDFLPYKFTKPSKYAKKMRNDLKQCNNHLVTKNSEYILERYRHIPQGGNWENIPSKLMSNYKEVTKCHTGIYKRLHLREPSVVIGNYRKNMLIHPTQDRGLSVREAARLQSFPDWFEFKGSIGFQQQQVGNAVPPLLANAVFQKIVSLDF